MVELYLHVPMRLRGVVPNELDTGVCYITLTWPCTMEYCYVTRNHGYYTISAWVVCIKTKESISTFGQC
jgi:hypothetical protein